MTTTTKHKEEHGHIKTMATMTMMTLVMTTTTTTVVAKKSELVLGLQRSINRMDAKKEGNEGGDEDDKL